MLLSQLFEKIESNTTDKEEKISAHNLLKTLIIQTINKKDYFHFTQTPFKELMLQNNSQLTLDISFVIRPKDRCLNIDLSTLTDDQILSAVTINLPSEKSAGSGAFNTSFKSKKQCKYDHINDSFIINETVNIKNIRKKIDQNTPNDSTDKTQTSELSEDKKAFIRRHLGKPKKDTGKGVYFLKNADGKQLSILPYVDGVDFFDFLYSDQVIALNPMDLRLRKIALNLALILARLHASGYMHCDIKPENIIVRKDDSTCYIDPDFITQIGEIITDKKGTREYYPSFARDVFEKEQKSTIYQDIYGTIICMLLLLNPRFSEFQNVYQESINQNNNAEEVVMNYFISTLKKEPGTYFSNIFLPFFLYPEKVTANDLLSQVLYIDDELAQHAIDTVTQNVPASKELLQLYIKGYNQTGKGLFTKEKKQFIIYLSNLLIQNKSFDETEFAKNNFQLITQEQVSDEITNLNNALESSANLKKLISRAIVRKIITYLSSDNLDQTKQIYSHYENHYKKCQKNKHILPGYRRFITDLLTVFKLKRNHNTYDHQRFLHYLTYTENHYSMPPQIMTSKQVSVETQPKSRSDAHKNSFFLNKRSASADTNCSSLKKTKLFNDNNNNISPYENNNPNRVTSNTLEKIRPVR